MRSGKVENSGVTPSCVTESVCRRRARVSVRICLAAVLYSGVVWAQGSNFPWGFGHPRYQGYDLTLLMADQGVIGYNAGYFLPTAPAGCLYPAWTSTEHLRSGGLWIGAVVDSATAYGSTPVKRVTTTNLWEGLGPSSGILGETNVIDSSKPWINRSTMRGDSGAVSENDLICEYSDTARRISTHFPLGIKVIQRSYAWAKEVRQPIIVMDYQIINLGQEILHDVFLGYEFTPSVTSPAGTWPGNTEAYWPEMRTSVVYAPAGSGATPIAFSILGIPGSL